MTELDDLLAQVEPLRDQIVAFHRDIVRIATVNTGIMPTGNETPCAEYLQKKLAAEGIDSDILESAPNRGNLIARIKGEGGGPTLMFMTHLDVVPVEDESTWTYPPFDATLADGKIWGRGSDDCKAQARAESMAWLEEMGWVVTENVTVLEYARALSPPAEQDAELLTRLREGFAFSFDVDAPAQSFGAHIALLPLQPPGLYRPRRMNPAGIQRIAPSPAHHAYRPEPGVDSVPVNVLIAVPVAWSIATLMVPLPLAPLNRPVPPVTT